MLHLATPTDPGWFDRIEADLPLVLVDHTHLEKRAASTALSLIFRYTGREDLPMTLSPIVREEMRHFEQMLGILAERGIELIKLKAADYATNLVAEIRKQEPATLLDKLLVAGLIEARSAERFQILSERIQDAPLAAYYGQLFESEARHYTVYTDLARRYYGHDVVKARLQELAIAEVEALRSTTTQARLHSW